jgi:hypothetical protein
MEREPSIPNESPLPPDLDAPMLEEVGEAQEELSPKEDLTPYVGRWVAMRDGYVVASHRRLGKLRKKSEVQEEDVLMAVIEPADFQIY